MPSVLSPSYHCVLEVCIVVIISLGQQMSLVVICIGGCHCYHASAGCRWSADVPQQQWACMGVVLVVNGGVVVILMDVVVIVIMAL